MFNRMIVAALVLAGAVPGLASDVAYDQHQIRAGNVTTAEGGVRPTSASNESGTRDAPPRQVAGCGCQHARS